MSALRRRYDLTREALRIAKLNTKRMAAALKKAKDEYDTAVKTEAMTERQFARASAEIDEALAFATTITTAKGTPVEDGSAVEAIEVQAVAAPANPQRRIPRSLRELVEAFPPDKATGLQDLRHLLDLSDGGLNARIQNAKRAGLVERVGWGQYQLTDAGRVARASGNRKLQLVSSEGA